MPAVCLAQNDDTRRNVNHSEIRVNNLDVIYDDEEYEGVVIDRKDDKETENYLYQVPFIMSNINNDEPDEIEVPQIYYLDDEGAESEDEILLEGFDTAMIHMPKFDVSSIKEPISIELGRFAWPTPLSARPSSHFGPRRRRFHYGLDLAQPTGEPIYAAFDGVVRISKMNRSYGNLVIIHHANGLETYYAHMSKRNVVVGQQVKAGETIGLCGNTGRSFGSHLHFEIRYMGNAINPENVMDCATHDLISDHLDLTTESFRKVAKGGKVSGGGGSKGEWYRVRKGDTLDKIARRNGTTVKRLCQLNGISQNKVLHPGERLRVSGSASSSSTGKASSGKGSAGGATYTVKSGDTLYSIARRNGTTVKKLCQINGISQNSKLHVGQKIRLQ